MLQQAVLPQGSQTAEDDVPLSRLGGRARRSLILPTASPRVQSGMPKAEPRNVLPQPEQFMSHVGVDEGE